MPMTMPTKAPLSPTLGGSAPYHIESPDVVVRGEDHEHGAVSTGRAAASVEVPYTVSVRRRAAMPSFALWRCARVARVWPLSDRHRPPATDHRRVAVTTRSGCQRKPVTSPSETRRMAASNGG
jgi:hypothetical protein